MDSPTANAQGGFRGRSPASVDPVVAVHDPTQQQDNREQLADEGKNASGDSTTAAGGASGEVVLGIASSQDADEGVQELVGEGGSSSDRSSQDADESASSQGGDENASSQGGDESGRASTDPGEDSLAPTQVLQNC